MERYYSFAGVEIAVDVPEERMYTEERHLGAFRRDGVTDPHRFRFSLVQDLTAPEGECIAAPPGFRVYREGDWTVRYIGTVQKGWENAAIRAAHRGREHEVQLRMVNFPERVPVKTVLNSLETEHLVTKAGGFVFHSSYIEYEGRAILFTAPSGTGKSTQAELWRSLRGAGIINGDRSVIRWVGDRAYACGIPFAGSSEYCQNRELPLAAVVYLAQAPTTSIWRLRGYQAFSRIWEGCSVNTWERGDVQLVSELAARTAQQVPVFYLPCTPDESAVIALETALKEVGRHGTEKL